MSPRRLLLGVMGVVGLTGLAAGEPPVNPFVEGREPNPVAREFHQTDSSPSGYVAPAETTAEAANGLPFSAYIWIAVLDQLTFPLGTAPMTNAGEATGA